MLSSHMLKVEDENTVLQFLYHYCRTAQDKHDFKTAVDQASLLTKALRFNYIDLYNLMSAMRKSKVLNESPVFVDAFEKEW